MNLPHVAFIGKAGAGKTTAAELLMKHWAYDRLSFAAPLKVACATQTDRGLLQDVGVACRALVEDFWVNLLIDKLYSNEYWSSRVVVDDARFPNEVARLKAEGFIIVAVIADHVTRIERLRANGKLQDASQLDHESETSLDDFAPDYTVLNLHEPGALLSQVAEILTRVQR